MAFARLIRWAGWAIVAVVVAIASFVMVASHYGWEFDVVLSGSMEPELEVGGLVVSRPADPHSLKVGDIISFRLPGLDTPVCHRVVDVEERGGELRFQTKGDANEQPDRDPVAAGDVTGKAVAFLPHVGYLGHASRWARTPLPMLGAALPAGGVVVLVLGSVLIGLIAIETTRDVCYPSQRRRKEKAKKRRKRMTGGRKALVAEEISAAVT